MVDCELTKPVIVPVWADRLLAVSVVTNSVSTISEAARTSPDSISYPPECHAYRACDAHSIRVSDYRKPQSLVNHIDCVLNTPYAKIPAIPPLLLLTLDRPDAIYSLVQAC